MSAAICPTCGDRDPGPTTVMVDRKGRRKEFFRCRCGREWTVTTAGVDRGSPVSADEVLAAHEALAVASLTIQEIVGNS